MLRNWEQKVKEVCKKIRKTGCLGRRKLIRLLTPFNSAKPLDDFCVAVDYEDIKAKKAFFSAGQYFEVKIEHIEMTPEEFANKMVDFSSRLENLFGGRARIRKRNKKVS